MCDRPPRTDIEILTAASRALGRIDLLGLRGITTLSVNDIEVMALALVVLGLVATPPGHRPQPQHLIIHARKDIQND